jgi:tRNA A-37 threonylcarbamoyl transferase component Bud32
MLPPHELEALLTELQLVEPRQLEACRRAIGTHLTSERLIDELEAQTFLTSYQAGRLRDGETDALRLGRYKLLYRNASGSFARVFRASSIDDGQVVAIKLLRQRYADNAHIVQLFQREGQLGQRLKHKNIVPIYEVACDGNQHYLTMEFVEGGNFRDFLRIRQRFSSAEATRYVLDVAEGLEYASTLRLTHRDLKLTNVLLSAQGVAKLVDFGLAGQDRALAALEGEMDRAIEYATLEEGSEAPPNDPRSDLYFLGAIYYELLTGTPPYPHTKNRDERRQFGRYRNVRPIRTVDPSLPSSIAEIVTQLMHTNPNERYQTPTQVIADLRRVLGMTAAEAAPSSSPTDVAASAPPSASNMVICVEGRPVQQNALRDYFTRHGCRVVLVADPMRALLRVEREPPRGLVLIGDALGEHVAAVFQKAVSRCKPTGTPVVLVLSQKLAQLREKIADQPGAKVLCDRVSLRDIRLALEELSAATS